MLERGQDGFVICSHSNGMRFRDAAAAPVPVELLVPVDDVEHE